MDGLSVLQQWRALEFESNAIEVLVGRVRRKLGVGLIATRRGHGYIVERDE